MYLFFDTETNGLPLKWNESYQNVDNWPRIIQLAFIVTDKSGNIIESFCELIKPEGWTIPKEKFWIDNGYSTETNAEKGISITDALMRFHEAITKCENIVAHNIAFDYPVVSAELLRKNMRIGISTKNQICTMKESTYFCGLPRNKWPKLTELHEKLFNVGFDGAHDALEDVRATVRCFFELRKLNII